jgi:hypothetical protein
LGRRLERGTCFGARRLAGIFFDDSILFSTISACLFSSLVAIGLLVVEISSSRFPPPGLHALMQAVRKDVASERYVLDSTMKTNNVVLGLHGV